MRVALTTNPPLSAWHVGGDIFLRGAMVALVDEYGRPTAAPARPISTSEAAQLAGYLSREALGAEDRDVARMLARQAAEVSQAILAQARWSRVMNIGKAA